MIVLVGRILLGALFIAAGYGKVTGIEGFTAFLETGPVPGFMAWPAAIFEIVAGLLIIVGFYTRYAAIALALFCVATGVFYHPGDTGAIMKNLALAGGFLVLYAHGAGLLSVDARRGGAD
jgi:putative oxidoreductase